MEQVQHLRVRELLQEAKKVITRYPPLLGKKQYPVKYFATLYLWKIPPLPEVCKERAFREKRGKKIIQVMKL